MLLMHLILACLILFFSFHAFANPSLTLVALTDIEQATPVVNTPRCAKNDIPDTPLRAFRGANGTVNAIASNRVNYRLTGTDLHHLHRDCTPIFTGANNDDHAQFNDKGWIHATYTADGQAIYALIHNEYHGHLRKNICKKTYPECWWNSITWAKSVDGGKTYTPAPLEQRLVIAPVGDYVPNYGRPIGFFNPSNIMQVGDYLYVFAYAQRYGEQQRGNYLLRKHKDMPWNKWEIWNGAHTFADIHQQRETQKSIGKRINVGVFPGLERMPLGVMGLVRHPQTNTFIAVMTRNVQTTQKANDAGIYYATSPDLVNWSTPQQLITANVRASFDCKKDGAQVFYRYASLLDSTSPDRNFSTIGNTADLYLTRHNLGVCNKNPSDRALVRVPVVVGY